MDISVLGIDISKSVFELCGMNRMGRIVYRRRLKRKDLVSEIYKIPVCRIVMESCGGAHYWGRELSKYGYEVKLIAPQFVKPYRKGNKTDRNDAEAICEASRRASMRFVSVKTKAQQEIQFLHRVRARHVRERTALSNEIRGFLTEYGIVFARGMSKINQMLALIEQHAEVFSSLAKKMFLELYQEFVALNETIKDEDRRILQIAREHTVCRRLMEIPGIGPITSTALMSAVGNAQEFKNGRCFSAWVGLVPREYSSAEIRRLGTITKRGDAYLRQLLVHGARAVVSVAKRKENKMANWVKSLVERRGFNKAVVAMANKTARIVWVILAKGESYRPTLAVA